jgi:acyl dehydratase
VAVNTEAIGRSYPAVTYAIGREKIKEFALATGETNPLYLDVDAAREVGYEDVVAPPMFAAVFQAPSITPAMVDPDVGIDFSRVVHGAQEFSWGPLVVGGDEITTTASIKGIHERGGMGFYAFEVESDNQRGERICTGIWTTIVRGAS